jgi:hypothetical protein
MDTPPTHEQYVKHWAIRYFIEPTNTSIIVWSKTIEESSNGITPCMVSETSRRLPVFVLPLTNDGTLFVLAPLWESQPYVQSSVELSLIGLQL